MVRRARRWWRALGLSGLLVGWVLGAGACSRAAQPTPSPSPLPTAQVVRHTATPTATPTRTPTPTTPCLDAQVETAAEVGDRVPAGQTQTYTWQVRNTGACPWPAPLFLAAQTGSDFAGQPIEVADAVAPGESVTVAVTVRAPAAAGAYEGRWQVRLPTGEVVPARLTLRLEVLPPTPTPTVTPGPPVLVQRQVDVKPGDNVNFDDGGPEVTYIFNGEGDQSLLHVGDHVYFVPIYYWPPDFADCYRASYATKNALLNPHYQVGTGFCFTTNEGRVGALRIDAYYVDARDVPHLVLTYLTWAAKRK